MDHPDNQKKPPSSSSSAAERNGVDTKDDSMRQETAPTVAAAAAPPAVRPGAVSVSDAAPRGKRRMTATTRASSSSANSNNKNPSSSRSPTKPAPTSNNDTKASIKREMDKLKVGNEPSRPGAVAVPSSIATSTNTPSSSSSSADPKARTKAEMNVLRGSTGGDQPQGPGAVPVTTSSLGVAASAVKSSSDPKARIKAEMNALGQGGTTSRPGAVSVSTSSTARTGGGGGGPGALPVTTSSLGEDKPSDSKARIKAEMNALRGSGGGSSGRGPQGPGAVPVTTSSLASSSNRSADPKARIKAEMDALRGSGGGSQPSGPGAVSVVTSSSTSGSSAAGDRPSDAKARIREEMEALRSGGAPSTPGAVSVTGSQAASDARMSRAARKARRSTADSDARGSRSSRSPQRPPPGTVDSARAKAEAEKLMNYDRHNQEPLASTAAAAAAPAVAAGATASTGISEAEADKLMNYDRHRKEGTPDGGVARAQAESNKSLETGRSNNSMSAMPSKNFGLEELTRQKKEAEFQAMAGSPAGSQQPQTLTEGDEIVSAVVVDEDALEAEYQQRLMENVVSAEVLDQKELDARNRRRCLCRCCCPLICVAIILGVVIPLTSNPDTEIITPAPSQSPTEQSEYNYLADLFEPISGDTIYEEGTPQYQALDWLLNDDPAMLDIKSENTTTLINRYVYATFYYTTNGAEWNEQLNFLSNYSVCDWHVERNGILCNDLGEPFFTRFAFMNLNGTIPSELSAVSTLTELNLVIEPNIYGTLPSEIGLLTQLSLLQVAETSVTGTIPTSYNNLLSLETYSFNYNGQISGALPELFANEDNSLESIFFGGNAFNGTLPQFKPQSQIIDLALDDNPLVGTFPFTFYSQPAMFYYGTTNTMITGSIAPQYSLLTSLVDVWSFDSMHTGQLPSSIGNMDWLENLRLSRNLLSGTIPSEFGKLDRMLILTLDDNDISGTIPSEIVNMRDMQELRLAGNSKLQGTVPEGFYEGLQDLITLTLDGTQLTGNYLNETFCQAPVLTTSISADCGGDSPNMPCECCSTCCADGECELNLFGACEVQAGIATSEERGSTCTCPPDGSEFTCTETCQVCNFEGTACAQTTGYGYKLDPETGENSFFENTYQYTLGYEDTVNFMIDVSDITSPCTVHVNGEQCQFCELTECINGKKVGYVVNCNNIDEGQFDHCSPLASPPGPLDVFKWMDGAFANDTSCLPLFPSTSDLFKTF